MGKKGRKRVAKEEHRNLRLWAEGARESVLAPHIPAYTDTLDRNWRDERNYLQKVCNEFHAQFSWQLEDHEEPDLPLPEYDLRAPAPVVGRLAALTSACLENGESRRLWRSRPLTRYLGS
ncbi:hypothetical protein B0H13DRAFT_2342320 [Mycena leptocephala]|nr:hypothetical protein B0H13DRAFT_2342320 [Mycena leptocephala]